MNWKTLAIAGLAIEVVLPLVRRLLWLIGLIGLALVLWLIHMVHEHSWRLLEDAAFLAAALVLAEIAVRA